MPFLYSYTADCASDIGQARNANQDSAACLSLKVWSNNLAVSSLLLGVADGVGGGPAGEVASKVALDSFCTRFVESAFRDSTSLLDGMARSFEHAHRQVIASAVENQKYSGMATTLTAAYILGSRCIIGHVGDSRCYLIRAGKISQLTVDHSHGNVLHHAVGVTLPVSVASKEITVENNDVILVCSDGLSNMVHDQVIADVVVRAIDATEACKSLIEKANENGGLDNISVSLARVAVRYVQR